jgi:exopolysaccharide biosynthesis polyprenyl glycosylphosphotransferase
MSSGSRKHANGQEYPKAGRRINALVAVKTTTSEPTPARPLGDIRSGRPVALRRLPAVFRRLGSIASLVLLDLAGLTLGVYSALALRALYYDDELLWGVLWRGESEWLPFLTLVTVLVFWHAGLYAERERRTGMGRIVASLVLVALIALAFGVGTDNEFTTFGLAPTALVLTAVFIGLLRGSYEVITGDLLRRVGVRRRAVLVGDAEDIADLRRKLGSGRGGIDYEFVGAVSDSPRLDGDLPRLGGVAEVRDVLARMQIDELIVSGSDLSEQRLIEIVEQAHRRAVKVRVAPSTTELLIQHGEYIPSHGVPLFELRPPVFAGTDWFVKRTFDYLVSAAVILVGLPFWLLIAALVKLTSPGPVLYYDRRIGVTERQFSMLKFRTMYAGADLRLTELEPENEASGALFKIRRDPRVTSVGAVLRRFSLDEMPQLLNVLRGEMSLVGPRPLPLRDYQKLEAWHRKRYLVLPGMTGLWQISGRSNLGFDDLVRLDFYYLENWSIWLDLSILLKTIPAVLARRGAY